MHLRFTEDELKTLMEMVSLATEIANVNQADTRHEGFTRFEAVENKVLETAKHHGFGDAVEFDETRGKNRVTEAFQKDSFFQQCYEEFRNASFWEELMIRLAERDYMKQVGEMAFLAMKEDDKRAKLEPLEKRYWAKFLSKGIAPLHWIAGHEEG